MRNLRLTSLGKFVLVYMIVMVALTGWAVRAWTAEINLHLEFAYNGGEELNTSGFKLYQRPDGETTGTLIVTIEGGDTRSWEGVIDAPLGRSFYTLTAFSPDQESPHSTPEYPFEYIEPETPGMPAPTVIFRFY